MKKSTAMLLLIVIIINTMVFVYAKPDESMLQNELAVKVFEKIEVIAPNEDLNGFITRLEVCRYIATLLHLEGIEDEKTEFTDTDDKYVKTLSNIGVVKGNGNGYFLPNDIVTNRQVVIMLIRALGYGIYEDNENSYWYLKAIRMTEIEEKFLNDNPTTMEDLIYLMYDAGISKVMEAESYSDKNIKYGRAENSLFNIYWNLEYVEGMVCSNAFTSFRTDVDSLEKMSQIQIGEIVFDTGDETAFEYIGQNIKGMYRIDENSRVKSMICFVVDEGANDTLKFSADEIVSFENNLLTYYKTDSTKTLKFNNCNVIYNGKVMSGNYSDLFPFKYGYVYAYKDIKSGDYTTLVINDIKYVTVSTVDHNNLNVYTDGDVECRKLALRNDDDKTYCTLYSNNGQRLLTTGLNVGDILAVARSKDGEVVRAILCDKIISGVIEAVTTLGTEQLYIIDGEKYTVTDLLNKKCNTLKIGSRYEFIVDENNLLYAKNHSGVDYKYGYIYMIGQNEYSPFEDAQVMAKIFSQDGEHIIAAFSKNVKFNNQKATKNDLLWNLIDQDSGEAIRQLVRYALNSKGEISYLDTAANTKFEREGDNTLWKTTSKEQLYYNRIDMMFDESCILSETLTTVFMVPPKNSEIEEKDFGVCKYTQESPFYSYVEYAVTGYKSNDEHPYADVIVYTVPQNQRYEGIPNIAIVKETSKCISGDEIVNKIEVNVRGVDIELYTTPECNIKGIKPGDLIRYKYDIQGNVKIIDLVYDQIQPGWGTATKGSMNDENSNYVASGTFGTVMSLYRPIDKKRNSLLKIGTDTDFRYINVNESNVVVWIVEKGHRGIILTKGTVDDITVNDGKIFVLEYSGLPKDFIFYR